MSGDINTALGNCLLMVIQCLAALKKLEVRFELFDDGDDCLILVDEADFELVRSRLVDIFLSFGQELKIENVARHWGDVVFCQSKIVHNGVDYIMVRDWRKVLSHACCGTKHWNDPNMVRPMLGLVGACELALNSGVPILQEFALALVRNSHGKQAKLDNADPGIVYRLKAETGEPETAIKEAKAVPITDYARSCFEQAFDVPVWQQLAIEDLLRQWTISKVEADTLPMEWDHTWNDYRSLQVSLPTIF